MVDIPKNCYWIRRVLEMASFEVWCKRWDKIRVIERTHEWIWPFLEKALFFKKSFLLDRNFFSNFVAVAINKKIPAEKICISLIF